MLSNGFLGDPIKYPKATNILDPNKKNIWGYFLKKIKIRQRHILKL